MKIRCEYLDGTVSEFTDEIYFKVLKNIIKGIKTGKGLAYAKFIEGSLDKAYINGELALDRERTLREAEGC